MSSSIKTEPETLNLRINDLPVKAAPGQSIFEAAAAAGIGIPHLCYHPKISVLGTCRLCVVEIDGRSDLITACTTPAEEGMVVRTESPKVRQARRMVLDLLLGDHPEDCLTCQATGECRLQEYCYMYGVEHSSFAGNFRRLGIDDDNPFFLRDHDKCILCGRCVLMCAENVGAHVYDFGYRGFEAKIVAGLDLGLDNSSCIFCGNCVNVCPTGSLQEKLILGRGRVYNRRAVQTVCPYCGVGCAITLQVNNGQIIGCDPAEGQANDGFLCVKGKFGWDFIQQPDRLKKPLIKEGGQFREASWDEALDLAARRLTEIKARHGPDALAGISSSKCTNEENYLMQKLVRAVFGTNNVDNCARLCHAPTITGLSAAFGSGAATNSIAELEHADVILVVGSNTIEAHPVIGFFINKAHRRGANIIVADPRKTDLAEIASIFLRHRPGTDVALLNGMMHVILEEGLEDEQFILDRTQGYEVFRQTVAEYPPERAQEICGVKASTIKEAARAYAGAEKATILYAMGVTQHTTGTDNVASLANLAMLTGNVGRESTGIYPLRGQNNVQGACDMGAWPDYLPGYKHVQNAGARATFEQKWGVRLPQKPGLALTQMKAAAADGRVKAVYLMGENPALSSPDMASVEKAFRNLDFLIVQDIFLTETARWADIVLPACSFAEKTGTFTNTERRVQLLRRVINPVGDSKPDWEIVCDLARRMGYPLEYRSTSQIMNEIGSVVEIYGGITYNGLGDKGIQWPCPYEGHPGTKFLHWERFAGGLGKFAAVDYHEPAEQPDEQYPLVLMTGRHMYHYHTGTMSRRSFGLETFRPEAYVELSPVTALKFGISEGDSVQVSTRRGSIAVRALVTDRVGEDTIFIPFHYVEAAANQLTNTATDPEAEIPELKTCAARIDNASTCPIPPLEYAVPGAEERL